MTDTTPKLTLEHLRRAGACADALVTFGGLFPDGAPLTASAMRRAIDGGLDVFWCERLMDDAALAEYEQVWEEAYAEYLRATGSAYAEYRRACDAALLGGLLATIERRGTLVWDTTSEGEAP